MSKVDKVPKGFQLPKSVAEWLEREEWTTGATFSRIALAAFCAYKYGTDSQRREYMQAAIAVEKGWWEFDKLTKHKLLAEIEHFERILKTDAPPEIKKDTQRLIREHKEKLRTL